MHPFVVLVPKDMVRKDYEKLFSRLEPPEHLSARILLRIRREQHLGVLKWRFAFFALTLVGTAVATIPAFQSVQSSLAESGSMQFLSLLFSDFGSVAVSWQGFGLAILESIPVMSVAIFLALVLGFFQSLKFVTRDYKFVLSP